MRWCSSCLLFTLGSMPTKEYFFTSKFNSIMFTSQVIGNLAADAEVKQSNGNEFVSFTVYHSEKFTTASGEQKERTQRVSCALNGNGGNLLPYLKKGVKVYVSGRTETKTYSSPKERAILAGVNLFVDRIELVGGSAEDVPRQLVVPDTGVLVSVHKCYYVTLDDLKANGITNTLWSQAGKQFLVDSNGFVTPIQEPQQPAAEEQQPAAEEQQSAAEKQDSSSKNK